jgi:hypothetical protein
MRRIIDTYDRVPVVAIARQSHRREDIQVRAITTHATSRKIFISQAALGRLSCPPPNNLNRPWCLSSHSGPGAYRARFGRLAFWLVEAAGILPQFLFFNTNF